MKSSEYIACSRIQPDQPQQQVLFTDLYHPSGQSPAQALCQDSSQLDEKLRNETDFSVTSATSIKHFREARRLAKRYRGLDEQGQLLAGRAICRHLLALLDETIEQDPLH